MIPKPSRKQTANAGDDAGEGSIYKPLYTVGENVNWCNHYENQYEVSSKK
jgi:hypothetical protein